MYSLVYFQQESHVIPTTIIVIPITNSQPENGSNITSKTPSPKPIKHTANVFLNSFSNILPTLLKQNFICYYNILFFM